ncbi:MAG TPA: TrmH family RNA methyltransferase [Mobilitalea sp.]|nr:TrmH family RNA methyltransferase [Mobilitalea sp.]
MKTEKIYSKNSDYQRFEVLKTNRNKRYKYNEFFVEGVRNINEAIKNNWHITSFLYTKEKKLSGWASDLLSTVKTDINYELTADLMVDLSNKEDTSELLAIVRMREDSFEQFQLSDKPILALFDRPSNKGNLGTIIRSCDALGVEGLIITGHAVDLYDPEVIVSSMGSFFNVPVIRVTEHNRLENFITDMKQRYPDFKTIGTTAHKKNPINRLDLTQPLMFIIGNETDGISKMYQDNCDILATIPMAESSSASSFNVGCAATVMFYEAARQRS